MPELVPKPAGNYACNKLTQADSRAEPSNTAGAQMLWRQIGSKGSAHRPETSLMYAKEQKKRDDADNILRAREACINHHEYDARAEKNSLSSPSVREGRYGIGHQCSDQVKSRIYQRRHQHGRADLLCAQDEKRIARITNAENGHHEQVFPVGGWKLSWMHKDFRCRAAAGGGPLRHQQDNGERQQARNEREIENGANVDLQCIQQKHRHDWTKESTRILSQSFEAEPAA